MKAFPNPFTAPKLPKESVDRNELETLFQLRYECIHCGHPVTTNDESPRRCPNCSPGVYTEMEHKVALLYEKVCIAMTTWWYHFTRSNPYPTTSDLSPSHLKDLTSFLETQGFRDVYIEVSEIQSDPKNGTEHLRLICYHTGPPPVVIGETTLRFDVWFNRVMKWLRPFITGFTEEEKSHLTVVVNEHDLMSGKQNSIKILLGNQFITEQDIPQNISVLDIHRTLALLSETS
jgi:hypothetical protein